MFRALLVAALVAAVSAFAPAGRAASSSMSMNMEMSKSMPFLKKPANLDGMIVSLSLTRRLLRRSPFLSLALSLALFSLPLTHHPPPPFTHLLHTQGNVEFDPLGFSDTYDVKWLREAELKHGRVSMLAVVGWLVQQAGVHLPSPNGLYDTANPIDAFFHVGPNVMGQIFLFIGALESTNHMGKMGMMDMHKDSDREVGMFENPIYGAKQLNGKTPAQVADLKLKELKVRAAEDERRETQAAEAGRRKGPRHRIYHTRHTYTHQSPPHTPNSNPPTQNGRLAMCAIGGLVHQTIIAGTETFGAFPNPQLWGEGQFVHAGGPGLFGL